MIVDVVFGPAGELAAGTWRGYVDALYAALARGVSLRDADDEAREAIGADAAAIRCVARSGAELRALSLR
jgi:hypothetical protein